VLVGGTLVLPMVHQLHCDCEGHGGHDASHCPICQLVNAPLHDGEPEIGPVSVLAACVCHLTPPPLVLAAIPGGTAQARAPPAA